MAQVVRYTDFPNISVEDTISLDRSEIPSQQTVEFVIEAAPAVKWWKGLQLHRADGSLMEERWTQDANRGPHEFSRPVADLIGSRLTLAKAKWFGIHTGMYEIHNLAEHAGRRLHFKWEGDEHRNGPIAGFFRDVGQGIATAADAVGGAVVAVVNAAAELVADVVETVGHAVVVVLDVIGTVLGGIPIIGPILRGIFSWLAGVVAAVFELVAEFVRAVLNLVGGVIGGLVRIIGGAIGGLLAWDGRLLVKGLGDVIASIFGPVLVVLGKVVAAVQAVVAPIFGLRRERPLTPDELTLLRRVYRGSVALHNVRIVEGPAGLFSVPGNREFTLGNTIYMKATDPAADPGALVHECAHVWQGQQVGGRYAIDALWAQATVQPDAYSWRDEISLRGRIRWVDFNREAQASFLEEVFNNARQDPTLNQRGEFYNDDPVGDNVIFNPRSPFSTSQEATAFARETVAYVRGTWPWRPTRG